MAAVIGLAAVSAAAAPLNSSTAGTPTASTGAVAGSPTVVVSGSGSASAPADGAIVQLILRQLGVADISSPGASGSDAPAPSGNPTPPTKEQVKSVVDALVKAGIASDATRTAIAPLGPFYGAFGQATAVIAFQLDASQVKTAAKFVQVALKQGEKAGVAFDAVNLIYSTADCASVANAALAAAIADARVQAEAMAAALGGTLGDLVQAVSQSSYGKSYAGGGGGGSNYCSQPTTLEDATSTYISSFDPNSAAEVEIYSNVSLTYALS